MPNMVGIQRVMLCIGTLQASALPVFDTLTEAAGEALKNNGVVVLQRQVTNVEEFAKTAIDTWKLAGYNYTLGDYNKGGSVQRPVLSGNQDMVYDVAAGAPADRPVGVHCEKSYQARVPHFVAFACFKAAEKGGEVQLVDGVALLKVIPPSLAEKSRRLGVQYFRRLGDEVLTTWWTYPTGTWQQRFGTTSFEQAQLLAQGNTVMGGAEGTWLKRSADNTTVLSWRAAAVGLTHQGEEALVNGIVDNHKTSNYGDGESPLHSTWGDGSEFTDEEMSAIRQGYIDARWASVKLQPGDVIVVDNFRFSHGRRAYRGIRKHAQLMSEEVPRGVDIPVAPVHLPATGFPAACQRSFSKPVCQMHERGSDLQ